MNMKRLVSMYKIAKLVVRGLTSTKHPILAQIIPMRRCNLACAYCNEYDKVSEPVPLDEMKRRIDKLASFGISIITISGGEPMLHPEIYEIINYIYSKGIIASLITNGYYLTPERIHKLNEARLEFLQISIDNVTPDKVSQKSLKVLDKRLEALAEHADFHVNINSVIGGGIKTPEDAVVISKRAVELGFSTSLGIIHNGTGHLKPLSEKENTIYQQLKNFGKKYWTRINHFQDNLAQGKPNNWRCRAGARYLYICEDGLVHYCSQQRGYPGIPLKDYTQEHIRMEFYRKKSCASYCTIACVQQVSVIDFWRGPQTFVRRPQTSMRRPLPVLDTPVAEDLDVSMKGMELEDQNV